MTLLVLLVQVHQISVSHVLLLLNRHPTVLALHHARPQHSNRMDRVCHVMRTVLLVQDLDSINVQLVNPIDPYSVLVVVF